MLPTNQSQTSHVRSIGLCIQLQGEPFFHPSCYLGGSGVFPWQHWDGLIFHGPAILVLDTILALATILGLLWSLLPWWIQLDATNLHNGGCPWSSTVGAMGMHYDLGCPDPAGASKGHAPIVEENGFLMDSILTSWALKLAWGGSAGIHAPSFIGWSSSGLPSMVGLVQGFLDKMAVWSNGSGCSIMESKPPTTWTTIWSKYGMINLTMKI